MVKFGKFSIFEDNWEQYDFDTFEDNWKSSDFNFTNAIILETQVFLTTYVKTYDTTQFDFYISIPKNNKSKVYHVSSFHLFSLLFCFFLRK